MRKELALIITMITLTMIITGCGGKGAPLVAMDRMEAECQHGPFVRNNYFYGKMMTVRDFEEEQSYFMGKQQLVNHCLHGSGVVCGLWVKATPEERGSVVVTSGLAIDAQGREILVQKSQKIPLNEFSGDVYLIVRYREKLIDSSPLPGEDQGMEYDKVLEDFEFDILTSLPEGHISTYDLIKDEDGSDLLERIFRNHYTCCNDHKDMPLVLAKINIGRRRRIRDEDVDNIHFRRLVLSASDILLCLTRLKR